MKNIAVLADIHGNLPALEAVATDIQARGVTTVVNLGDHASGPLWPSDTLSFLMQQPWTQIAGNHDRQLVQQPPAEHGAADRFAFAQLNAAHRAWLQSLPARARLHPNIVLCHGTPTSDTHYLLETVAHGTVRLAQRADIEERLAGTRAALVLCGHTHIPRVVHVTATTFVVNPGSVGVPAFEVTTPELHVVENGSPDAWYALLEQGAPGWRVELIAVPYDYLRAARQAQHNGRGDWEVVLRTGYMRG